MIKIKNFTEYQRNKNNFLNAVKGVKENDNERKNNYEDIAMLDSSQKFRDQERDQIREYQQNKNDLNFNNRNNNQNKFNNRNEQNRFENRQNEQNKFNNRQNEQNKKENDKNRNNNMK